MGILHEQLNKIIEEKEFKIPLTVPEAVKESYRENYLKATASSGRLFLFAGDQKIEHLNEDFYGNEISAEAANPEHLFEIASQARIGAFASQLPLIARYGDDYRNINYIVKLNAKTNLVSSQAHDPISLMLHSIEQVIEFKKNSGLSIIGIGCTLYVGSEFEAQMMAEIGRAFYQAHQHGLITVLWCYPRGKGVGDELSASVVAGASGVGLCLGADFIKVNAPRAANGFESAQLLAQATLAAGRSRLVCSGGKARNQELFLEDLYHQIHTGGARGVAIGRNIHQKSLTEAILFCKAVAAIVFDDVDVDEAKKILI